MRLRRVLPRRWTPATAAMWLTFAILLAWGLAYVVVRIQFWEMRDVEAYWEAALRLRAGEPLYADPPSPTEYNLYRYAPWFAWLWVPLTFIDQRIAYGLWAAVLLVASAAILWALLRLRTAGALALAAIMAPWLLSLVEVGNVQPLVVAALGFGISRRSGPLWVGVAASLKASPLLYVLVYVARRQWRRVLLSLLATAVLLSPLLLTDLSHYDSDPGLSFSLYGWVSPAAWLGGAALAAGAATAVALRRSPWTFFAIGLAMMFVQPRSHVTTITFLLVGLLVPHLDRLGFVDDRPAGR